MGVLCTLESCCCSIISSFFSPISHITIFRHTFLRSCEALRPSRLKLGTHVDSGQMYHAYQNQAAAAYLSLYFLVFFFSNFQTLKFFVTLFSGTVRPWGWNFVHSGQWTDSSCVSESGYCCLFIPLFLHFSFSQFFVTLFSGIVRLRRLKLGTHMDSGQLYCVYWNQATATYLSLYFFIFLSIFRHTFLRSCEA